MKKSTASIFIAIFMVCIVLSCLVACVGDPPKDNDGASEEVEEINTLGLTYNLIKNDTAYEIWDTGSFVGSGLVIPSTYNEKPVIKISDYAFYKNENLTSITIPSSIIAIGKNAFEGCTALVKTNFIGTTEQWAKIDFSNDTSNPMFYAKSLYINGQLPTSVNIASATKIPDYAFNNCSSITSVTIGNSVTSIGYHAFYNCTSLKKIILPSNLSSIDTYAFYNCPIEEVTAPISAILVMPKENLKIVDINGGDSIADSAFRSCSSITSVTIGDSVTSIGSSAFSLCISLSSVTIGKKVADIGSYAFYNCTSLKKIILPSNLSSTGADAFYNCPIVEVTAPISAILNMSKKKLKIVDINGGDSIADYAFNNCSSITSVTISNSVTSIGRYAFSNCSSLTSITFKDTSTWYRVRNNSDYENKTNGIQTNVLNASTNATSFKSTYCDYYWYKL